MGSIKNTCPEVSANNFVLGGCSPDFATIKAIDLVDDQNVKTKASNFTKDQWDEALKSVNEQAGKINKMVEENIAIANAIVEPFKSKNRIKPKGVWRNGKLRPGKDFKKSFYHGNS